MDKIIVYSLIFSFFGLIVIRMFMAIGGTLAMPKKAKKQYRSEVPLWKRWLLLKLSDFSKDKYSKSEKKTIAYTAIARIYRAICVSLHIMWLFVLLAAILVAANIASNSLFNVFCFGYFVILLVVFFVLAIIEFYENSKYHKKRMKR